jgi:hypothetical protein
MMSKHGFSFGRAAKAMRLTSVNAPLMGHCSMVAERYMLLGWCCRVAIQRRDGFIS